MRWSKFAFEYLADLADIDERGVVRRVHRFFGRRKHDVATESPKQFHIAREIARIIAEIFLRRKLRRVDEDRGNRQITFGSCRFEQAEMPIVESPHRWDQADGFSRLPRFEHGGTHGLRVGNELRPDSRAFLSLAGFCR